VTVSPGGSKVEDYSLNVNSSFVDWLTINPEMGIVTKGTTEDVDFTFDATDLDEGDYYAEVTVNSNDPDQPQEERYWLYKDQLLVFPKQQSVHHQKSLRSGSSRPRYHTDQWSN